MTARQFAQHLKRRGLTHEQAATILGVNRSTVWRWAKGRRPIPRGVQLLVTMYAKQGVKQGSL